MSRELNEHEKRQAEMRLGPNPQIRLIDYTREEEME